MADIDVEYAKQDVKSQGLDKMSYLSSVSVEWCTAVIEESCAYYRLMLPNLQMH